jgi:tripartite-type tricarboxylate transporter receptor subunit TctC
MNEQRRNWLRAGASLACGAWPALQAQPSPLPARLRILCGSPPGGTPDQVARRFAERLGSAFLDGVIVENRPGAGALVAAAALKQAAPDASTWLIGHGGLVTVNPELPGLRIGYDPQRDLVPLAQVAETAFALAVGPAVPTPVTSLTGLLDWWRAEPAQATFATPGIGTLTHLVGALLGREAGIELLHVAFSGGPQAIGDLLGGRIAALILPEGLLKPLLGGAPLRLLATSGERRSAFLPSVPTFAEQGFPGIVAKEWFAFFVPGGTPGARIEAAARLLQGAAAGPTLATHLETLGLQLAHAEPATVQRRIEAERRHWAAVIKRAGIRIE